MKELLIILLLAFPTFSYAQQSVLNDISSHQADISTRNSNIAADNNQIVNNQTDIVIQQAAITADNSAIASETAINAAYQASIAQTPSGVNWDYFVTLEPSIPFAQWSKVNNGINWTSIIPTLGISCGGITEANVNWTNWGNCESKGMTPGTPFGGKPTGIAAFWCGNGSIAGTC